MMQTDSSIAERIRTDADRFRTGHRVGPLPDGPVPLKSPPEREIPIALRNTRSCVGVKRLMTCNITVKNRDDLN